MSSLVTTLTDDACSETFSSIRVAVTTTGSVRTGSCAIAPTEPASHDATISTTMRPMAWNPRAALPRSLRRTLLNPCIAPPFPREGVV